MRRFFCVKTLDFANGVLCVRLTELLEGEEGADGLIGRPLEIQSASRTYEVVIEQVGHFQVRPEPVGGLSEHATPLQDFLYREENSSFHVEYAWGTETFVPCIPQGATVAHYVVYAENYVVDVLTAREPKVTEIGRGTV
jgi:hypothetical protein